MFPPTSSPSEKQVTSTSGVSSSPSSSASSSSSSTEAIENVPANECVETKDSNTVNSNTVINAPPLAPAPASTPSVANKSKVTVNTSKPIAKTTSKKTVVLQKKRSMTTDDLDVKTSSNSSPTSTRNAATLQCNSIDLGFIKRVQSEALRKSLVTRPTKASMVRQRAKSAGSTTLTSRIASSSTTAPVAAGSKQPTQPMTPNFRVEKRLRVAHASRPAPMTTEERELAEIAKAKKEAEARLQKTQKMFEKVKVMNQVNPQRLVVRSTKELTVPTTPKFKLSKRLGQKTCSLAAPSPPSNPNPNPTSSAAPKGPTIPEPFHFATEKRVSSAPLSSQPAVATSGELAAQFFFRDARRSSTQPSAPSSSSSSSSSSSHNNKKVTEPKAPTFKTDIRLKNTARPKPLSREEQEDKMMKEIESKPFKARAIDQRIFSSVGELGVPKVPAKPLTEPVAFEFRTDKRCSNAHTVAEKEKEKANLTLDNDSRLTKEWVPKVTVAVSPKLSGGRASSAPARRQKPHHDEAVREKEKAERLKRQSIAKPLSLTEPKEFNLITEKRHSVNQANLEEKIKRERELEAAAREVRVKPVPEYKPFVPEKPAKTAIQVEEFHLRSIDRHNEAESMLHKQLHDAALKEQQAREVKAKPVPKSTYEPTFKLVDSHHAPVIPKSVTLESDLRAQKRKEFDDHVMAKAAEMEKKKEEEEKTALAKELAAIKELKRKSVSEGGMAFKANPILTKDLFPTKPPPPISLTEPKSPYLLTKRRARPSEV